jgi:hypothetical protein
VLLAVAVPDVLDLFALCGVVDHGMMFENASALFMQVLRERLNPPAAAAAAGAGRKRRTGAGSPLLRRLGAVTRHASPAAAAAMTTVNAVRAGWSAASAVLHQLCSSSF